MKGFFTRKETESNSRPDGKVYSCSSCKLYRHAESPRMKPYGNFKKRILVIGEAPGEVEDAKGKLWQGKTGRLLKRTFKEFGIDLFEDCVCVNAVNCRPPENRTPTPYEIACCRTVKVNKTIQQYTPDLIILLGSAALKSFLAHRWKKSLDSITKWRGWVIPDQDYNCWVLPTFHPSYVSRSEQEVMTIWKQDLQSGFNILKDKFEKYKKPNIEIISDLSVLDSIKTDMCAFDFETTGIKPYAEGHRIVCCSVANSVDHVYVFNIPETRKDVKPFLEFLRNTSISKIAHNMKYEDTWAKVRLRTEVKGWEWDSMLAAHLLDNRPGVTGLKFQTYVNFGIVDYSSEIEPYFITKHANDLNRIFECDQYKLLEYCALDSIFEYRLALKQMQYIDYNFLPF